jgi:hypothetical protein
MSKKLSAGVFFLMICVVCTAFESRYFPQDDGSRLLQVDSPFFSLMLNPLGGRLQSLQYKPAAMQLTDPESIGSGAENVWNIPKSRFFLQKKPFTVSSQPEEQNWLIEAKANHAGGGINFLQVEKKIRLYQDAALLSIDYRMENLAAAMSPLDYAFWFHQVLGVYGELTSCWYPTTEGIVKVGFEDRPTDAWLHRPARGWLASLAPSGKGVAITMSYPELKCFYSWFANMKVPTLEWRLVPLSIAAGEAWQTRVEILPFQGLSIISGAGGGLVGEISGGNQALDPGESRTLTVKVHNARKGKIQAELFARALPDGKWESQGRQELQFAAPATLQEFNCQISCQEEKLLELEVVLSDQDKELARLNSFLSFGNPAETWSISPLEERVSGGSAAIELLGFNKITPTEHIPWAKPYSGGKIRSLILTQNTNIPEVSQLAQRLEMDFTVPFLMYAGDYKGTSPLYRLGDYFGATSFRDIDDNLKKALQKDYDVIIIGGLPWEYFQPEMQKLIEGKIQRGAGLVYIGADKENALLPLKNYTGELHTAVPKMLQEHFLTSGIPFAVLPAEPVFACQSSGDCLASADEQPYMVTGKCGRGTVVALNYKAVFGRFNSAAGLTPNLPDSYPDRGVPYEFYYSLLAKSTLYAAGKLPQALFTGVALQREDKSLQVEMQIDSQAAEDCTLEFFQMDRYMRRLHQETHSLKLQAGQQKLQFALPAIDFAGQQTISAIIRNAQNQVVIWGSWSIEDETAARISALETDKPDYQHGEMVHFTAQIDGNDTSGLILKAGLEDSYQRMVAEVNIPVAGQITGELPIQNALPARFYRLWLSLWRGDREIDRTSREFQVCPVPESLRWLDYEPGTWMTDDGSRFYLWKYQAEVLRQLKIKTLIANWRPLDHDFPIRHNFHPTMLQHVGLKRCAEPEEYAKTGNKMLLVRKPCLSEQEFLQRTIDTFAALGAEQRKHSLRFYWLGDEQSITGYGGAPIDFCFSQDCLREFRHFLKQKYADLDAVNREWECNFATWDEVVPFTKEEIWENNSKNVAGWADHLEFMDGRLENIVRLCAQAARKNDPAAEFSISGTQAPTAYGGMDWWRQMKVFDGLMNYPYVGGQHELQRSFRPDAKFIPWEFGYRSRGGIMGYKIWRTLFTGCRGIMGFSYPSLVNPDWSLSKGMADSLPHFQILTTGVGKHYINNLRPEADIAVLYSQASIRAAFIEKRRDEHRLLREKLIFLLRHIGVSFDFISYEQLTGGILKQKPYQTLILPDSTALSDEEITAIANFAGSGRKIIAIGRPGIRQQNCRPRQNNPLIELLRASPHVLLESFDHKYMDALAYPDASENYALLAREQQAWRDLLDKKHFATAIQNASSDGKNEVDIEYFTRFDSHGNPYYGLVTKAQKLKQLTLQLPKTGIIYNLVNGKKYDWADAVELPFCNSLPVLLAVLPQEVAIASAVFQNGILEVNLNQNLDSVIRVQVIRPNGQEYDAYANNLLVSKGKASWSVPFVKSDPAGEWRLVLTEIISRHSHTLTINR